MSSDGFPRYRKDDWIYKNKAFFVSKRPDGLYLRYSMEHNTFLGPFENEAVLLATIELLKD